MLARQGWPAKLDLEDQASNASWLANGLRPLLWPNQSTTGLSTVSSVSTIPKLEPPCERACSALVRPLGWIACHLRLRPAQRRFVPRYFLNFLCSLKHGCSTVVKVPCLSRWESDDLQVPLSYASASRYMCWSYPAHSVCAFARV